MAGTQTAGRPDLCRLPQGGRDPREAVREVSRPSRRRALPDPQLRRAADRRSKGLHRGAPLRRHRARRAARAAHAVAHLHARRCLGGLGRDERALGGRREGEATSPTRPTTRSTTWSTRTCSSAATATRARPGRSAEASTGIKRALRRRPTRSRRCRRATRSSAARGSEAAQLAADRPSNFPFTEAITVFLARARRGAQRRRSPRRRRTPSSSRRCTRRCTAAKNNYWATEVEVQRLAAAGLDRARAKAERTRRSKLMRAGRRHRGQEREAHRHAGPAGARARAAGRHAARAEAPADALKEFEASQQREPNRFRGLYGAGAGGGAGRQPRQGAAVLHQAGRDWPAPATRGRRRRRRRRYIASNCNEERWAA